MRGPTKQGALAQAAAHVLPLLQAHRKAALKHHPDKGGDEEKFKEVRAGAACVLPLAGRTRTMPDRSPDRSCFCWCCCAWQIEEPVMPGGVLAQQPVWGALSLAATFEQGLPSCQPPADQRGIRCAARL